ncbi:MAG: glycoside hydrolase family 43 protein [Lachnospiraceae bacterium]|nr:glycoside hydrolase family 43 protein [Lachnospiraceae bacterium]
MKYTNPIVKGFYPDPSVCAANGKYYLVCSSFQYFPGVPLFESEDLVNWKQIGYVLTRKTQVMLEKINSSGGVFAPTIRYNDGRFYMVTTNDTTHQHFYVYTDDIYGEWSEPIVVDQDGIDPSLYFEDGRTFFISNGTDDYGESGVIQSEINIETGEKLTHSKCIWKGSGGRFLESPHMYKINGEYYLMAAEGGTEYGHMITYARGNDIWGPFTGYPKNPVVTNRNTAPEIIQGIGHGDLIQDKYGNWHILSLGFRQIHIWQAYHTLGREVFLYPVEFGEDGWFTAGTNGVVRAEYEMEGDFVQQEKKVYTFENTDWKIDWAYLRHPAMENYEQADDSLVLHGTDITLDDVDSPTFMALRQRDFCFELTCKVSIDQGEAGATVFACENEHFDVAIRKGEAGYEGILKFNVGPAKHLQKAVALSSDTATVIVRGENCSYSFYIADADKEIYLGSADAKYVSTEVAGGFTGVMLGLYAVGNNTAKFTDFEVKYE